MRKHKSPRSYHLTEAGIQKLQEYQIAVDDLRLHLGLREARRYAQELAESNM